MIKNLSEKNIYVIDDEPDILEAVKIILEDAGYSVKAAQYLESVDEIIDFSPRLIILDALLNGQSGPDICILFKKSAVLQNIPVLLLSALPASELKLMVTSCGAVGYLQKPFDLDTLTATVKKYLS